jgi:hypothetical protein
MMQMVLNIPDDVYEKMRVGMKVGGFFTVSFKDIENFGIDIVDVKYMEDVK